MAAIGPGTRIGRYEVVRELGQGGMGAVFEARDPELGRRVALKVVLPQLAADPGFRMRFALEARAASAVRHPHVVGVHELGEERGLLFMALEFVEGGTVRDLLRGRGSLPAPEACDLARQVALGLAAVHAAGLVHRDLKPENVLVGADGRARISDFGLVRCLAPPEGVEALTRTGELLGTLHYMAPEQSEGSRATGPPADVYALGCLLFEALAGRRPFEGQGMGVVLKHLRDPAPRLAAALPGAPLWLDALVASMLAKAPEERPSASEVAARLEAAGAGRTGAERPPGWRRAGLLALGAVAAGVAVAVLPRPGGDRPDATASGPPVAGSPAEPGLGPELGPEEAAGRPEPEPEPPDDRFRAPAELEEWEARTIAPALESRPGAALQLEALAGSPRWTHRDDVVAILSVDADRVVTVDGDGGVRGWDARGRQLWGVNVGGAAVGAALAPTRDRLVVACRLGRLRWLSVSDGRTLSEVGVPGGAVSAPVLDPAGEWLAVIGGEVLFFGPAGGELMPFEPAGGAVRCVALGPGVLWAGGKDGQIRGWERPDEGRRPIAALAAYEPRHGGVRHLLAAGDGRLISAGTAPRGEAVKVWRTSTGELLQTLVGHERPVEALALSSDGRRLLTGGGLDRTAREWDLETGRELARLQHLHRVQAVACGADGRLLTGGNEGIARVWAADGAGPVDPVGRVIRGIAVASGRIGVVAHDRAELWDLERRTASFALAGMTPPDVWPLRATGAVAFEPDEGRLLVGTEVGFLRLARGHEPQRLGSERVLALTALPDGRVLALGKTGALWQSGLGLHAIDPPGEGAEMLAAAHTGPSQAVVGTSTGTLARCAFEPLGGDPEPIAGRLGTVRGVAVLGEGRILAATDHGLWVVPSGGRATKLAGASSFVAASPDGVTFAWGDAEGIHLGRADREGAIATIPLGPDDGPAAGRFRDARTLIVGTQRGWLLRLTVAP